MRVSLAWLLVAAITTFLCGLLLGVCIGDEGLDRTPSADRDTKATARMKRHTLSFAEHKSPSLGDGRHGDREAPSYMKPVPAFHSNDSGSQNKLEKYANGATYNRVGLGSKSSDHRKISTRFQSSHKALVTKLKGENNRFGDALNEANTGHNDQEFGKHAATEPLPGSHEQQQHVALTERKPDLPLAGDSSHLRRKQLRPTPVIVAAKKHGVYSMDGKNGDDVMTAVEPVVAAAVAKQSMESREQPAHFKVDSAVATASPSSIAAPIEPGTIYFSSETEQLIPKHFNQRETNDFRAQLENASVVSIAAGSCGRDLNRQLTFLDGSKACVRYRINMDQIQGDLYSQYLARLLHITSVPPGVLIETSAKHPRWKLVTQSHLPQTGWIQERVAIATPWLEHLEPVHIPHLLRTRSNDTVVHPLSVTSQQEWILLAQWSDMIVFDYLTGNMDRVVNNLFNLQYDPRMLTRPAHNVQSRGQALVLLDQESGLLHSYRLLDKYAHYHEQLLQNICLFRVETVRALRELHSNGAAGAQLQDLVRASEPNFAATLEFPASNQITLQMRLNRVIRHIEFCQRKFASP